MKTALRLAAGLTLMAVGFILGIVAMAFADAEPVPGSPR